MAIEERDELPHVMQEIADAMGALGSALTLHPDDGGKSQMIYATDGAGLHPEATLQLLGYLEEWPVAHRAAYHWTRCELGPCEDALSIPVERIPGHSRLVITAFFEGLTEDRRAHAEAVYLARRPFAIGYFRLWQLERTRARRIKALEAALNAGTLGVILLDRTQRILFSNQAAEELLHAGDGIRSSGGTMAVGGLGENIRFRVAVDQIIHGTPAQECSTSVISVLRSDGTELLVSILPTNMSSAEQADAAALVYVLDPRWDTDRVLEPLCRFYQLTRVETKLVCKLVAGKSIQEAAAHMRLKEQTARSYLKQVFIKTGTHRQSDLVRVMLSRAIRTVR